MELEIKLRSNAINIIAIILFYYTPFQPAVQNAHPLLLLTLSRPFISIRSLALRYEMNKSYNNSMIARESERDERRLLRSTEKKVKRRLIKRQFLQMT